MLVLSTASLEERGHQSYVKECSPCTLLLLVQVKLGGQALDLQRCDVGVKGLISEGMFGRKGLPLKRSSSLSNEIRFGSLSRAWLERLVNCTDLPLFQLVGPVKMTTDFQLYIPHSLPRK